MRTLALVRSARRAQRRPATSVGARGLAGVTAFACALAAGAVASPAADESSPAPKPAASSAPRGPLRHLVFGVTVDLKTQTDMHTRSVDAALGGNTEHYEASGSSRGTITCDVVGVTSGSLLVDVTEDASERSSATKRVAVQNDGAIVYLPNQGTLNEEEAELAALLAPGLIGGDREIGDTWNFRLSSANYTATKTFRLTDIKSGSEVSLNVEEVFARTGADALTGTVAGSLSYDPAALVPLGAKLDKTTRQEDSAGYKTRKIGMDFVLKEDSRAKH